MIEESLERRAYTGRRIEDRKLDYGLDDMDVYGQSDRSIPGKNATTEHSAIEPESDMEVTILSEKWISNQPEE